MSRFLALTVTALALLASPAFAEKAISSQADCSQAVADVIALQTTERLSELDSLVFSDVVKESEDHCARSDFGQADELLGSARAMLEKGSSE